jgi:hypothetical protein
VAGVPTSHRKKVYIILKIKGLFIKTHRGLKKNKKFNKQKKYK